MSKNQDEISDQELNSLTEVIKTKYGIDFTNYEKKSLKRGFARLVSKNNFNSVLDLWRHIITTNEFIPAYIDELTVNLTELFRNLEVWESLQEILSKIYASERQLRIWHAGCSTGEEVYSMAIILHKSNMIARTKALATDLSNKVISVAEKGEYSDVLKGKYEAGFNRLFLEDQFEEYFDLLPDQGKFKAKRLIQSHVTFKTHNLVTDPVNQEFDIVFCRNVMIYFDEHLKIKVLSKIYESLAPDGFLVIGFYDSMPPDFKQYFELYNAKSRIYRKTVHSKKEQIRITESTAYERLRAFVNSGK